MKAISSKKYYILMAVIILALAGLLTFKKDSEAKGQPEPCRCAVRDTSFKLTVYHCICGEHDCVVTTNDLTCK